MRLSEALRLNQQPILASGRKREIHLVCGFTPLHLETFLAANARLRFPGDQIQITCGLFGDLEGNLTRAAQRPAEGVFIPLEWSDLDPRLGMRTSAIWSDRVSTDVIQQIAGKLRRIAAGAAEPAKLMPVALVPPTLPLPPLSHFPPVQANALELHLRCLIATFLNQIKEIRGVRLLSEAALNIQSPHFSRYDAKLDLYAGFPYSLTHAAATARQAIDCLFPTAPKKGLITDLDDTLWKGIVGEVGSEGVSWSLEEGSQPHALYQQVLRSLAESGVLVGVASKNDPAMVTQAFQRPDILVNENHMFPIEVGWRAKSESVSRILKTWNVSPDSVVFVDDCPMELAEVAQSYPEIECLRFPSNDPAGVVELLWRLRSSFGKTEVCEEDRLRAHSMRSAAAMEAAKPAAATTQDFLAGLGAAITFGFFTSANDPRAFQLVNKTNQFNLNGRRYTETEWRAYFYQKDTFAVSVSYEDRFGPLGKIAVLAGRAAPGSVDVDVWVMSCRAFSRQIEFQMLRWLFEKYRAAELRFEFRSTLRNGPLADCFRQFLPSDLQEGCLTLPVALFERKCPMLHHKVVEVQNG